MKCIANECDRKAITKGCCDKHYRRLRKNGSIDNPGSRSVALGNEIERFHQKYEKTNSCWVWTAGTRPNSKGALYGRHWTDDGKSIGAHRFSYLIHYGDPGEMFVCHSCDNPLCVNPDHLFLGSHKDNMRDMVNKGRSFTGSGESKKGRAKLTNKQAINIRNSDLSQSKLAAIYGVSQTTIGRIKRKESYPCN